MHAYRIDEATIRSVFWNQDLGDTDLVIPKPLRTDNAVPIAGDVFKERWQLAVVGLAYCVTTGVGPLGVRLRSVVPGGLNRIIWECVSAGVAVASGIGKCIWPLSPPESASPSTDGARLTVERVGSVLSAQLTVTVAYVTAEGHADYFATPPHSFS